MSLVGKISEDIETAWFMEILLEDAIKSKKYDDGYFNELIQEIHKFHSGQIDHYKISHNHYRQVILIHKMDSSVFKDFVPEKEEAYLILHNIYKNYPAWKEDQPKLLEEKAWDSFTDELQIGVQRILRDKGAASREVFDAINDTVAILKKQFSMNKKSNLDF